MTTSPSRFPGPRVEEDVLRVVALFVLTFRRVFLLIVVLFFDVALDLSTEFVVDGNVENQVAVTAKVDVFEHQIPPPRLLWCFCTEGMLRRSVVIPACRQMASMASPSGAWTGSP